MGFGQRKRADSLALRQGWLVAAFFFCAALLPLASCEVPRIMEHPLDMTVSRNDPVTLVCKARGDPSVAIEWFREGEPVRTAPDDPTSHRILLPDGSLFFLKAVQTKKDTDAGVYWCVAANKDGVARSNNATLDIAYMRDDFRVVPRDTEAGVGSEVTLRCSAPKGHPAPIVRWSKDNEYLDLTSSNRIRIDDGGNLVISDARKEDSGRYQCSARNLAATKDTKPVKLQINEAPSLVSRPSDKSALAGEDVLLECAATGEPQPDVVWSRVGADLDTRKPKAVVVHGKGLRIESAHPSDEGTYVCEAANTAGTVSASARLTVSERPVITVRPQAHLVHPAGTSVSLDCMATGAPKPSLFWSLEGSGDVVMPGSRRRNMYVNSDGALKIEKPTVEDSGQYVCTTLNVAGAAMARAHLVIFDPDDFESNGSGGKKELHAKTYEAEAAHPHDVEEARLALLERTVKDVEAAPISATSLRVSWHISANKFADGVRVNYRRRRTDRYEQFATVSLPVSATSAASEVISSSFHVQDLEADSEYEVFVQPTFRSTVVGLPSALRVVRTLSAAPASAPDITVARMLNATAAFVAWTPVTEDDLNGPLIGYQIEIVSATTSKSNVTVSADSTEVILLVAGMAPDRDYAVRVSAFNAAGAGPSSSAALKQMDATGGVVSAVPMANEDLASHTWLIALLGSLAFILVLISALMLYYRRRPAMLVLVPEGDVGGKTNGYLVSNVSGSTSVCRQLSSSHSLKDQQGQQLWIDRRWNGADCEKDSNSSERKLLSSSSSAAPVMCNNNASDDNEYTYIDRRNLSTFNHGCGYEVGGMRQCKSPEPYATTDILRQQQLQQIYAPVGRSELTSSGLPLCVTPLLRSRTAGKRHRHPPNAIMQRSNRSCDNIVDHNKHYAVPIVPHYAKVSLERLRQNAAIAAANRHFAGEDHEGNAFYFVQPASAHPTAASKAASVYAVSPAVRMSPARSSSAHRVQPSEAGLGGGRPPVHGRGLPTPIRLTSEVAMDVAASDAASSARLTAHLYPKQGYRHSGSRSSCSSFSAGENTPFLEAEKAHHRMPTSRTAEAVTRFDEYLADGGDCSSSSGSSGEAAACATSAGLPGLSAADVLDDLRFHQIMAAVAASNVASNGGGHLQ